ncbi:hypothetical protein [Mycobacteroides abscessus]|uniref:hypothetical protein n=1 Tax=Mycobacteroides abscessus TaxID=36809 RepID=UPI001041E0A2|nr:hypothetical protein [Mycobacteroides abscessus]MBN7454236.1 hypothetical protein [Mycobacteroides abscessus subsp. abscessus]MBN7542421.1 hypothetical protein [Mycobacteroides abscessus subsp. abscessus]MBN7569896.1 hypothetical protein [Mycobacteroides abscessus subsp. abscessus]QSM93376.1 hypothetical protein I3U31_20340 [Mycobacteroides abscessus subsp. abscessus]QSM98412.1 hypothetical protein I3U40_20345 [Mycobacteroides abscessus subsp. abscessus]
MYANSHAPETGVPPRARSPLVAFGLRRPDAWVQLGEQILYLAVQGPDLCADLGQHRRTAIPGLLCVEQLPQYLGAIRRRTGPRQGVLLALIPLK